MSGRPSHRLIKRHRSHSVEEVAETLRVHKNTVRNWLANGLAAIDDRRPTLILGLELVRFLREKAQARKRPCLPGQIYCVRCREPRRPAGNMADYVPLTPTSGNLMGICSACESLMFRRVALARLGICKGALDVQTPKVVLSIGDRSDATGNCDSGDARDNP